MESLRRFIDAVEAFVERLAAVHWGFLAAAVAFSVGNLALRSRAWQQILRAALPGERIRYRTAFGAYCAGVGVNAVIPARVGDLMKMFLVRRSTREARYPTLAGSLVAETLFDMAMASGLILWALWAGVLPGVRLPDLPAFDLSLAFRYPVATLAVVSGLVVLGLLLARRVREFWRRFGQGLAIVRTPRRYLRSVVIWQALGWGCRIGGAFYFLQAFDVPAGIEAALIVQVAGSMASLFPATPGGLGPKQALLVVMLAGSTGRGEVLAFSAGMELTLLVTNALLGLTCIGLMVRSLRLRTVLSRARADRRAAAPEEA
ncbi:lysylphosphatidylglycerol synthase transmembrane domain-containing protein [Miltoncostaea marina]|uniref:lysylphosphatidylglycerol synthase transmembrane domain-containing protein n=1 Tax=Miltoncostaea marina TaxID=2843215 RepID=UPI001C3E10B8|nr:lysylphosphatidylglycerol synthase transmembrane domain-containing protein [Miltoncostaea marina]